MTERIAYATIGIMFEAETKEKAEKEMRAYLKDKGIDLKHDLIEIKVSDEEY